MSKEEIQNAQNSLLNQTNEEPIYRHLFSIEPAEVNLEAPLKGNCVISYHFPFE